MASWCQAVLNALTSIDASRDSVWEDYRVWLRQLSGVRVHVVFPQKALQEIHVCPFLRSLR